MLVLHVGSGKRWWHRVLLQSLVIDLRLYHAICIVRLQLNCRLLYYTLQLTALLRLTLLDRYLLLLNDDLVVGKLDLLPKWPIYMLLILLKCAWVWLRAHQQRLRNLRADDVYS